MVSGEYAGPRNDAPRGQGIRLLEDYTMKRGMVFGSIIVAAMLAFELFNYSTTDFALANLLGDLKFMGLRWAMILAIAFSIGSDSSVSLTSIRLPANANERMSFNASFSA